MGENPSALLKCLHLEALGVRLSLRDFSYYYWWLPPPRQLGAATIIEQRLVIVSGFDRGDCEGFLTFLGWRQKGTLVDCSWLMDPHLVLVVQHPVVG